MSKEKPSTDLRGKGSIVLELLAVVLAAALIFTLTYPAKLWKAEAKNQKECRENIQHVYYAEVTYLDNKLAYTDTLKNVVDFILSDTSGQALKRFANLDSILGQEIIKTFKGVNDLVTITVDSVFGEGPDSMKTLTKSIKVSALVDSMLSFAHAADLDTTEAFIIDSLRFWPSYSSKIDAMAEMTLQHLFKCPTDKESYLITVNNDSTIKQISVACPVDSAYSLAVKKDFKLGFLGGLKIENHGSIDNGGVSWKK
jgi:hypothetical protein